jgi:hypothetical protein
MASAELWFMLEWDLFSKARFLRRLGCLDRILTYTRAMIENCYGLDVPVIKIHDVKSTWRVFVALVLPWSCHVLIRVQRKSLDQTEVVVSIFNLFKCAERKIYTGIQTS